MVKKQPTIGMIGLLLASLLLSGGNLQAARGVATPSVYTSIDLGTPLLAGRATYVNYVMTGQMKYGGVYSDMSGYKGTESVYCASASIYDDTIYGPTTQTITAQQDLLVAVAKTETEGINKILDGKEKAVASIERLYKDRIKGVKPSRGDKWPIGHRLFTAPPYLAQKMRLHRDLMSLEIASRLNTKYAVIKGIDSKYVGFLAREDNAAFNTLRTPVDSANGYIQYGYYGSIAQYDPPEGKEHAVFDLNRISSIEGDAQNRIRPLPIVMGAKVQLKYVVKKEDMDKYWDVFGTRPYDPATGMRDFNQPIAPLESSKSGYYAVTIDLQRDNTYGLSKNGIFYEFSPDGPNYVTVTPTTAPKVKKEMTPEEKAQEREAYVERANKMTKHQDIKEEKEDKSQLETERLVERKSLVGRRPWH